MNRDVIGEIIFWAVVASAIAFYGFSAPADMPWDAAMLPTLVRRFPVWGYFVEVFYGHYVALSIVSAAVTGGFIGVVVNGYLGWRFALAAALTWVVWPGVWNRAVTGAPELFSIMIVVFLFALVNMVALVTTERARYRLTVRIAENTALALKNGLLFENASRHALYAGYLALGLSIAFAGVSISRHDYRLGRVAGAYARIVTGPSQSVEEWASRWTALEPFLASRDAFIPTMRGAFAEEGLALADALRAETHLKEAWDVYWRVFIEIDPGNGVAIMHLDDLVQGGFSPGINPPLGPSGATESALRKAINRTEERMWVFRVALARLLRAQHRNAKEVLSLLEIAVAHAPSADAARIREDFSNYFNVSDLKLEHVIITEPDI